VTIQFTICPANHENKFSFLFIKEENKSNFFLHLSFSQEEKKGFKNLFFTFRFLQGEFVLNLSNKRYFSGSKKNHRKFVLPKFF